MKTKKQTVQEEEKEIEKEAESKEIEKPKKEYVFPPIDLLGKEPHIQAAKQRPI